MIGARQDYGKTLLKLKRGRCVNNLRVRSHTERGKQELFTILTAWKNAGSKNELRGGRSAVAG